MHWIRRAASRAAWTAGKSKAIRTAMMAMTTRSSISVKPALSLIAVCEVHQANPSRFIAIVDVTAWRIDSDSLL